MERGDLGVCVCVYTRVNECGVCECLCGVRECLCGVCEC